MILESDVRSDAASRRTTGPPIPPGPGRPTRGSTRHLGPVLASVPALDAGPLGVPILDGAGLGGRLGVALCLSGAVEVSQDGVDTVLREGQLTCVDGTRPHWLAALVPSVLVVVGAEHHRVGLPPEGTRGMTAASWSGEAGVYGLMADTVGCLAADLDRLSDTEGNALGLMILDLIGCLLAEQLRKRAVEPAGGRRLLTLKILCHVRSRLGDANLMPEHIARHFGISLRYLQVLFAELGTSPARWIRDERLSRLRDDLADAGLDHLPVSVLGEKCGIPGASQVSRLFRVTYGLTPSEYRRAREAIRESAGRSAPGAHAGPTTPVNVGERVKCGPESR